MTILELYWQYCASAKLLLNRMKEVDQKTDAYRYRVLHAMYVDTHKVAREIWELYGNSRNFEGNKTVQVQPLSFEPKEVEVSLRLKTHAGPINHGRGRKAEAGTEKSHHHVDPNTERLFNALLS